MLVLNKKFRRSLIIKFYRINQFIKAETVRLIGPDNKQIGIISKFEALKKAQELGVDLVEVAGNANPPVCRLVDFKKFKYQESKKEREQRKKSHETETKEIRLSPFIAKHDWQIQVGKAQEFLKSNNKVRVVVKLLGRQITKTDFAKELINKTVEALNEVAKIERETKMEGRQMVMILAPK